MESSVYVGSPAHISSSISEIDMLMLLLLAAGVHMDQSPCANARTALGEVIKTDSWGAAPPNTRVRFAAVAGHSCSQCSIVSASASQCGQIDEKLDSMMFLYGVQCTQRVIGSAHFSVVPLVPRHNAREVLGRGNHQRLF